MLVEVNISAEQCGADKCDVSFVLEMFRLGEKRWWQHIVPEGVQAGRKSSNLRESSFGLEQPDRFEMAKYHLQNFNWKKEKGWEVLIAPKGRRPRSSVCILYERTWQEVGLQYATVEMNAIVFCVPIC